jgi:hypothetical protein
LVRARFGTLKQVFLTFKTLKYPEKSCLASCWPGMTRFDHFKSFSGKKRPEAQYRWERAAPNLIVNELPPTVLGTSLFATLKLVVMREHSLTTDAGAAIRGQNCYVDKALCW